MKYIWLSLIVFLQLTAFVVGGWAQPEILKIGTITHTPNRKIAFYQPFADYLAQRLRKQGIADVRVVFAPSIEEMVSLFKNDQIDLYFDGPFSALKVESMSQAKPLLRRWKRGVFEHRSLIFVRKDSGIDTVDQLKGRMIVLEKPFSTVGYWLPKASFLNEGVELFHARSSDDVLSNGKVGYVFSNDDETTMVWVLRGKVAAGALTEKAFKTHAKQKIDELKVIYETISVPKHVVLYREGLAKDILIEIKALLTKMHIYQEGDDALSAFENTMMFDEFPGGENQYFMPIKSLQRLIDE